MNPWRMLVVLVAGCVALLAGCAEMDRGLVTRLQPDSGEGSIRYFVFTAFADAIHPLTSEGAEQTRLAWLARWLQENGCDPTQYEILSRVPVLRKQGFFGDSYDIYYDVRARKCA